MAIINLSQAAKLAGVTRQTLYKHIETGKISKSELACGSPGLDTAEIMRVYGKHANEAVEISQSNTAALHSDNEKLRAELKAAHELLTAKDAHIDTLKKALVLLENRQVIIQGTPEQTPAPTPKRTFMQKFFGWE